MLFNLPQDTLVYSTSLGLQVCADSRVILNALPEGRDPKMRSRGTTLRLFPR